MLFQLVLFDDDDKKVIWDWINLFVKLTNKYYDNK